MPFSIAMKLAKALGVSGEDLYCPDPIELKEGQNDGTATFSVYFEDEKIIHSLVDDLSLSP